MNFKRTSVILASLSSIILAGCGTSVQTTPTSRGLSSSLSAKGAITGTKRALLVGINKYMLAGNDLQGCVNDIDDVKAQLLSKEGFTSANTTTLLDKKATRVAILDGLKKLAAESKPGDFLYFHYSGHGAPIPDTNGDEADGQDEILCPTDLSFSGDTIKNGIVDDELQTILGSLKPGVGFLMISDSCYSGTIDRSKNKGKARTIRLPRSVKNGTPMISNAALQATYKTRLASGKYVVISGCQEDQTSADAYINNRYNGAATYYFLDAYKKGGSNQTYGNLHKNMVAGIVANDYEQRPNLIGPADAKLFTIIE